MLIQSDASLIPLPDKSIHCVVTSPPYWGLRKYKGKQGRVWGGDPECEHEWGEGRRIKTGRNDTGDPTSNIGTRHQSPSYGGEKETFIQGNCIKCGAWFGSLGLEPTPQEHIQHIVEIMREVRRVLRDDGVVWLNYGDCYSAAGWESSRRSVIGAGSMNPDDRKSGKNPNLSAGNLMLMPHRIAIALQDDGWIVRNDLVWWKRNPMPESVAGWRWEREKTKTKDLNVDNRYPDERGGQMSGGPRLPYAEYEYGDDYILRQGSWRHTRAHEYVFQLVKGMGYYSNQEAVREMPQRIADVNWKDSDLNKYSCDERFEKQEGHKDWRKYCPTGEVSGRNPRSVLDVPTSPYSGAHYATFPPDLIAPLIRASCPRRCCPECGQAWAPVMEKGNLVSDGTKGTLGIKRDSDNEIGFSDDNFKSHHYYEKSISGYRPICSCGHEDYIPGIVLDPFVGSGTTVMVARELLRKGIGLDISMEYLDLQANVRTGYSMPSKQLEELPLFEYLKNKT